MPKLPIPVRACDCEISPSNVRKSSDPAADLQFRANVAARGIIQNLIGVPFPRKKGQYRIVASGRRLDAVHSLIEAGTFAADYCIPVLVLGDSKVAIEISLSENFFKLDMNPADACRAFQDIIALKKKTPVDVAKRFGLPSGSCSDGCGSRAWQNRSSRRCVAAISRSTSPWLTPAHRSTLAGGGAPARDRGRARNDQR